MCKTVGAFMRASLLLALAFLAMAGCATNYGARAVAPSGYEYNSAIAHSQDEQLLLNIVRLRYRDTIVFMDVGSVTTQRQYVAGVSAENLLPFKGLRGGASLLIPGATYSETPTVSYAPLKGSEFARNLLSPISAETIVLLANSGWSIERLLACCVQRLGGLANGPRASGPTPLELPDNSDFREAASILRKIQREERVYVEYDVTDGEEGAVTYLVINAEEGAECSRLETLLSATGCLMQFRLVERKDEFGARELLAKTRTVLGALYTLSHAVAVPPEHSAAGLVTMSEMQSARTASWDDFLAHQFGVKSGRENPDGAFVKVHYRGYWFWIDDADLESKTTFSLLSFLLSLQSAQSDGASPLLTLSAG
jgi:uncharacterized protein YcfL